MDFTLTPEQLAFKKEAEDYFKELMKDAPPGWIGGLEDVLSEEHLSWVRSIHKKLVEKGWLVLPWPKEYGGQDAPVITQLIFNESFGYHRVPSPDVFGVGMLGPTLLSVGNEEQKKEHLPPIARAERYWCQGWSEPNAGSDLAALVTKAVRDGDDYVLNGQKTWTSGAHLADWCFLLVRTDPEARRSRGLSFLVMDMKTPGVTVRPLLSVDGTHIYNEVYLDDVRVPIKNRVGEENQGWAITRMTMNFERSGVGGFAAQRRDLEQLVEFCKETKRKGKSLAEDPIIRSRLAQLAIEIEAGRSMAYRIAWIQETKGITAMASPEFAALASASKVYGSELGQRLTYTANQIMGLYGQFRRGSKWAPFSGKWDHGYELACGMNIAAGSSEIQRLIIAWSLGLPKT
jgi:alkylation response protein AidB-like acyl-CoA dehydrogenase